MAERRASCFVYRGRTVMTKRMLQMTAEQARATDPRLTAWVGASAGTGKTHVLTARVLRLMVTGTPPENILCLTFTKAAAAEMKNRIFAELGRWSSLPDQELSDEIYSRTSEIADAETLVRCRELFARVLDLSGGFQIVTFHSFCQSLLGRFPLEAGMTPGFESIDENDAIELMATAKDRMLAATKEPLAVNLEKALNTVAGLVTENTFDEVIDRLVFEAPVLVSALRAYGGTQGLAHAVYRSLDADSGITERALVDEVITDATFDRSGIKRLAEALAGGTAGDQKRAGSIDAFLTEEHPHARHFEAYLSAFLTKTGTALKTVATKSVLKKDEALISIIEAEQTRLLRLEDRRKRLRAATATVALLQLGLEQLRLYRYVKSERGLVDFDDMIDRTVTLFSQADMAPWVLYKLDHQIDHILVDEAQDTNPDQWHVVETLAAEFFAGETARKLERTVFAVGDAKQSIFSFQRADPREFIRARDRIFGQAVEANAPVDLVPLDTSFRSGEAVLALVDQVFSPESRASYSLSPGGEIVQHRFARAGHGGLVELWPLESVTRPEIAASAGWQPPTKQETVDDEERRAANRIADHVSASIGKRQLAARGRPVEPGDIMVLVRRRTAFVDHLIRALKARGVPVTGRDRMNLLEELPVMDLLMLAQFALLPDDDLALATVLKGPFIGFDDNDLFTLAHGRSGSLWQALIGSDSNPLFAAAGQFLRRVLAQVDLAGPFDFFSHILVELDGRKKLAARLGEEIHDPLDELLEEAMSFQLRKASSLMAFCESLKRANTQIKRDMEQAGGQVRIMTTHSAKGLQAPIVYLSDVTSMPDTSRDGRLLPLENPEFRHLKIPIWASQGRGIPEVELARESLKERQLAEYRRLLYVALTRAEDELYVAGWRGAREPSEDCWYRQIEAGFERLGAEEFDFPGGQIAMRHKVSQKVAPPAAKKTEKTGLATMDIPSWVTRSMPSEPAPTKPLTPSRPDEDMPVFSPLARVRRQKFKRGNLLHQLLQWLPDIPVEGRPTAAKTFMQRMDVAAGDQKTFLQEVQLILDDAEFAKIFGPNSRAEVPIAGVVSSADGAVTRTVSGQVDRLFVAEDRVMVIDYKTNRPPPLNVQDVPDVYLRQMGLYARVLGKIYPDKTISCALLWTDGARLMPLPEDRLDAALSLIGL